MIFENIVYSSREIEVIRQPFDYEDGSASPGDNVARCISRHSQGIARKLQLNLKDIERQFCYIYLRDTIFFYMYHIFGTHRKRQNHKIPSIGRAFYEALNNVHELDKAAKYDHQQRRSAYFP